DAENDENYIEDPEHYTFPDGTVDCITIYARIEGLVDDDPTNCFSVVSFLICHGNLEVDGLDDLEECDHDNDGASHFDLTENDLNALDGLPPEDFEVTYYESETYALAGQNAIEDPAEYQHI